jgi:hypothetical protein
MGNPAIASPAPGILDLAVQVSGNKVVRRRLANGAWSAWSDTEVQTVDDIALLAESGETRILIRSTDDQLVEGMVGSDGGWQGASGIGLGGALLSRPQLLNVPDDVLPRPSNVVVGPSAAVPAAQYLFALGADATTSARKLGASGWDVWQSFDEGPPNFARPLCVSWPFGDAYQTEGESISSVSVASWIGRSTTGEMQANAMWWREQTIPHVVSTISIYTEPWQSVSSVSTIASDLVGLIEPQDAGSLMQPTLWAFGRLNDGFLFVTSVSQAPVSSLNWDVFGESADGDPALLIQWERYEDAPLFHVVIASTDGKLKARRGGTNPEPVRVRPQPSSPVHVRPR